MKSRPGDEAPARPLLSDPEPAVAQDVAGDVEALGGKVVGDKAGLAVLELVECGGLLGVAAEIGELAVMPHGLNQEGPSFGFLVEVVGKGQPAGVAGLVSADGFLGPVLSPGGPEIGGFPGRPGGLAGGAGHFPIVLDGRPGDKGRRARGGVAGLGLDPHHQVGIGGFLHQEGIDRAAFANQRHVGPDLLIEGLEVSEIGRSRQVPVLGIADNEVQDVFTRGQDQDGCVTGLGPNLDDLIGLGLDAENAGRSGRCGFGRRGGLFLLSVQDAAGEEKEKQGQHRRVCSSGHQPSFARCSMPRAKPYCSTARDRFSASAAEDV